MFYWKYLIFVQSVIIVTYKLKKILSKLFTKTHKRTLNVLLHKLYNVYHLFVINLGRKTKLNLLKKKCTDPHIQVVSYLVSKY